MSRALDELLKEERDEGMKKGLEKGLEKGRENARNTMIEAMRRTGFTEEQIEAVLNNVTDEKVS